jgi:hypothetical protein
MWMFEALAQVTSELDADQMSGFIDGLGRMWGFVCGRVGVDDSTFSPTQRAGRRPWRPLPARTELNVIYLQQIWVTDGYEEVIPSLYAQAVELFLRLNLSLGSAAQLELQWMMEDLPALWANLPTDQQGRLSWGLRRIQKKLISQLDLKPPGSTGTGPGAPGVWEIVRVWLIDRCTEYGDPGLHPEAERAGIDWAFNEALREVRRLFLRLGFLVPAAA